MLKIYIIDDMSIRFEINRINDCSTSLISYNKKNGWDGHTFVVSISFISIQILCLAAMTGICGADDYRLQHANNEDTRNLQWKNKESLGWAPFTNHCMA
jgi:hypothetical protein